MNNLMKILKNLCPPLLWNFLKTLKNKTNSKYYGLNQLDKKIETFVNFDNGFFVELGANDGISKSNTYYFEKYRGWNGVLIEPIGQKYLECIKNRSNKNKIFCNACVSFNYNKKFVEMTYSNLMTISNNLESDLKNSSEHLQQGMKYLQEGEKNYKFGSVADTLNNILLKSNAPKKIDLLSLDVEGSEMEVLKGINHKKYRFKYLCIETRDCKKLSDYLLQNDYILLKKLNSYDYLFKDNTQIKQQ